MLSHAVCRVERIRYLFLFFIFLKTRAKLLPLRKYLKDPAPFDYYSIKKHEETNQPISVNPDFFYFLLQ